MNIYTHKNYLLDNNIVTKKNKVNTQIQRREKFKPHIEYIKNVCEFDAGLLEMIYCLYNALDKQPQCKMCTNIARFMGFKKGYAKYCNHKCYASDLHNYDYGLVTKDAEKRRCMVKKATDTRIKNGNYNFSSEHKNKLSISAKKSIHKKRKTCKERYGVENPGVMGGYSSKAANSYIKKFIADRNIDLDCCLFNDAESNKKELFQMIYMPKTNKMKYTQYDLVVFKSKESAKNKNINDIILVLEYNGPWHYTLKETMADPYSLTTPYRGNTNNTQKIESFIYDKMKRKHFNHVKEYYTFWEKDNSLRKGSVFL